MDHRDAIFFMNVSRVVMSNILNVEQSYIVKMWNWLVSEAPGLVFLSHTVMRPRDSVFVSVFSVFSAFRGSSAVTTECTEHTENTETTDGRTRNRQTLGCLTYETYKTLSARSQRGMSGPRCPDS